METKEYASLIHLDEDRLIFLLANTIPEKEEDRNCTAVLISSDYFKPRPCRLSRSFYFQETSSVFRSA